MAAKLSPATSKLQSSASLMSPKPNPRTRFIYPIVRASQSMDDKSKVYKELGQYSSPLSQFISSYVRIGVAIDLK